MKFYNVSIEHSSEMKKKIVIEKLLIEQGRGECKLVEIMWMSEPVDDSRNQSFKCKLSVCFRVRAGTGEFWEVERLINDSHQRIYIFFCESLGPSAFCLLNLQTTRKISDTSMTDDSKCALKSIISVFFTSTAAVRLFYDFHSGALWYFFTLFSSAIPPVFFRFGCCLNSQIDFLTMCSFYTIFVSIFMRLMQSCFPCATLKYHKIYYFTTRIVRLLLLALVWAC